MQMISDLRFIHKLNCSLCQNSPLFRVYKLKAFYFLTHVKNTNRLIILGLRRIKTLNAPYKVNRLGLLKIIPHKHISLKYL